MVAGAARMSANVVRLSSVAAVIMPCSSRKRHAPETASRAVSLTKARQGAVETAWLEKVALLPPVSKAGDLYGGRGASLGRRTAEIVEAPLYIASAGLGLVDAGTVVPTYGMTVARRGEDSIPARVEGSFDPVAWWSAVCGSPASTTLDRLVDGGDGRLTLVALTGPYAAMLATALDGLPPASIASLRIFGWRLHETLPRTLHDSIMPYDARLEATIPGTRNDFAQRAMLHFGQAILPDAALWTHERHRERVSQVMGGLSAPVRAVRPRVTDADILAWLARPAQAEGGIGRLLRRIRDEGVACEQARFARLHTRSRMASGAEWCGR